MKINDLESAVNYLKSSVSYEDIVKYRYGEEVFDLKRFSAFLDEYCPEYKKLKAIHVTGSKGKGTTSNLIYSYLNRVGFKAGVFNSPYILNITESIGVGGKFISLKNFIKYVNELKKFREQFNESHNLSKVSYFELLTAIGFKYFVDCGVDYVVLEVGLGGRLDSTNVCRPVVTVLTRVEKEHTEILGKTYTKILNEKLGIVKEWNVKHKVPLIVAPQKKNVKENILSRRLNVPVFFVEKNFDKHDDNYSTALVALLNLVNVDLTKFDDAYSELKMIGRFDVRRFGPVEAVFDMAHTPQSAEMLVDKLNEKFGADAEFVFIFSMMKGKDAKGFFEKIKKIKLRKIIFTSSHETRSESIAVLNKIFRKTFDAYAKNIEIELIDDVANAFEKALIAAKKITGYKKWDRYLVVTGSHFLISKILRKV